DTAFRQLTDWVDYVLDQERRPLEAWVQSTQFDFESFTCSEEPPDKPKTQPASDRRRSAATGTAEKASPETPPAAPSLSPAEIIADEDEPIAFHDRPKPSEARMQLDALEAKFLAVSGPLDAPERQALWPTLAQLNSALGNEDAIVCW